MPSRSRLRPTRLVGLLLLALVLVAALSATFFVNTGIWQPSILQPEKDWTTTHTADIFHLRLFCARKGYIALIWVDHPFPSGTLQSLYSQPPAPPIPGLSSRLDEQDFRQRRLARMQATIAYRNTVQGLIALARVPATFGSGGPLFERSAPGSLLIAVPIWQVQIALGFFLALTLFVAWRTLPRFPAHHCQSCGYDRAGLAQSAVCPECGKATAEINPT